MIDSKVVLNPITVRGRAFLLENIIQSTYPITRYFEEVSTPTTLLYGKDNVYIGKQEMHILAHYIEVSYSILIDSNAEDAKSSVVLDIGKWTLYAGRQPTLTAKISLVVCTILKFY